VIPPRPPGSNPGASLGGVSCVSATFCVAVGSTSSGPLAYACDGTGWTMMTLPPGSGADTSRYRVEVMAASAGTLIYHRGIGPG
jgi:hypothetical protein